MADRNEGRDGLVDGPEGPRPDVSFVVNTEALERITPEEPFEPKPGEPSDPAVTPDRSSDF